VVDYLYFLLRADASFIFVPGSFPLICCQF